MSADSRTWPPRVHHQAEAERRFGSLGARIVPYLEVMDPLADAAAEAISVFTARERSATVRAAVSGAGRSEIRELDQLVDSVRELPVWVNEERLQRAGVVFRRAGLLGGVVLGLRSLVYGYAAPAGNKPLAISGRLTERAERRLAETSRFVQAVTDPQGLLPFRTGFRICLMVRLMHAEVRRLLLTGGRYERELWSAPINQHDMLATILLFSNVFIRGVRLLGVAVNPEEADDYQHLFRWVGELMGVESALLPSTFCEAERLTGFMDLTQGAPDDDSRALVDALLTIPLKAAETESERARARLAVGFAKGLCRSLIGEQLADQLDLPRDSRRFLALGVRATVSLLERARLRSTRLDTWVVERGARYWTRSVSVGLGGEDARYDMPDALGAVSRARAST